MKFSRKKNPFIINALTWKIAGKDKESVTIAGRLFSNMCARAGAYLHTYSESGNSHTSFQVTIANEEVKAAHKMVNFFIALNKESIEMYINDLGKNAIMLYEQEIGDIVPLIGNRKDVTSFAIPFTQTAKEMLGDMHMSAIIALGATIALCEYDKAAIGPIVQDQCSHDQKLASMISKALEEGDAYVKKTIASTSILYRIQKNDSTPKQMVISGNKALGLGVLKAGVTFASGPSESLLDFLEKYSGEYHIQIKKTNALASGYGALGASLAGARTIIATSDTDFSLTSESLGFSTLSEIPLVYIINQHPGPIGGMDNWTEQSDLRSALHAGNGEFPRIIVAPGDGEESFYVVIQACNLAEKFQIPIIILTDQFLTSNEKTVLPFDTQGIRIDRGKILQTISEPEYKRYLLFPQDGVSPRTVPGTQNGIFSANSYEHDEYGHSTDQADMRIAMQKKRLKKFEEASKELPEPVIYGPQKADFTLIGWGSTKSVILEAMDMLKQDKIKVNFLQLLYVSPFPSRKVNDVLELCKTPVLVENNMTAQLGSIISEQTGYAISNQILKYDGRPFFPEEIYQRVRALKSQKGLGKWMH